MISHFTPAVHLTHNSPLDRKFLPEITILILQITKDVLTAVAWGPAVRPPSAVHGPKRHPSSPVARFGHALVQGVALVPGDLRPRADFADFVQVTRKLELGYQPSCRLAIPTLEQLINHAGEQAAFSLGTGRPQRAAALARDGLLSLYHDGQAEPEEVQVELMKPLLRTGLMALLTINAWREARLWLQAAVVSQLEATDELAIATGLWWFRAHG